MFPWWIRVINILLVLFILYKIMFAGIKRLFMVQTCLLIGDLCGLISIPLRLGWIIILGYCVVILMLSDFWMRSGVLIV
jgi:hypothetical protein